MVQRAKWLTDEGWADVCLVHAEGDRMQLAGTGWVAPWPIGCGV